LVWFVIDCADGKQSVKSRHARRIGMGLETVMRLQPPWKKP
jgi:hypothetical protein